MLRLLCLAQPGLILTPNLRRTRNDLEAFWTVAVAVEAVELRPNLQRTRDDLEAVRTVGVAVEAVEFEASWL
jgi:hypothetical protein